MAVTSRVERKHLVMVTLLGLGLKPGVPIAHLL